MMQKVQRVLLISAFLCAAGPAQAQNVPYNDFAPRQPNQFMQQADQFMQQPFQYAQPPAQRPQTWPGKSFRNSDSNQSDHNYDWAVANWRGDRRRRLHFNNGQAQYQNQYHSQYQNQYQNQNSSFTPQSISPSSAAAVGTHPDRFADSPQVDAQGVRRFANGRHHDLSSMSVDQAVAESDASDNQIRREERQQRSMARRRRLNYY